MSQGKKLSLFKKKQIATKLLTNQGTRVNIKDVANATGVTKLSVRKIQSLIETGHSLTHEELSKHPALKSTYDKELVTYIDSMKKMVANISLNNAELFLREAGNIKKIKKLTASQAQLSGKIALDTALMATGEMPTGDAPQVHIYLPKASKEGWKIEKVVDAEIVDEHKDGNSRVSDGS